MKLVVLCLFAVCCCSLAKVLTKEREKLQEVLKELNLLKNLKNKELKRMKTPPKDIEDCCCLPALTCFQATLGDHFGVTEKVPRKLYRSLNHTLTRSGLNFCHTENSSTSCPACDSHPEEEASEFFSRLESLIQRGMSRLN